MSIGSFFEKIGSEIEKLFKETPTWAQKALQAVAYLAPLVQTIATLAGGAAVGTEVGSILSQIKGAVATVSAVAQAGTPAAGSTTIQTVTTALNSINTNMAALLASADIKNNAKVTDIEATTNLITGEVDALLTGLSTPAAPAAPAA